VEAFTDAIAFNWLIAGTDAHAKNYSLLIGSGAGVRLAPIYDLASILPYRAASLRRVKLAMRIGGEYRLSNIGLRHWQKMANELRLDEEALIDRVRSMALALPDTVTDVQSKTEEEGLSHETISKLAAGLRTRAAFPNSLLTDGGRPCLARAEIAKAIWNSCS
jgi:serine/threonine-protein kinase HipA